jgi:hypothetical protein
VGIPGNISEQGLGINLMGNGGPPVNKIFLCDKSAVCTLLFIDMMVLSNYNSFELRIGTSAWFHFIHAMEIACGSTIVIATSFTESHRSSMYI